MAESTQPLEDEKAAQLDRLADETEGIPRLRELDGYLLLDTGDGETIVVFKDTKGTRRELLSQLTPATDADSETTTKTNALIERQDHIEDYEDREPEYKEISAIEWIYDEYVDDSFMPDEEPDYEVKNINWKTTSWEEAITVGTYVPTCILTCIFGWLCPFMIGLHKVRPNT